MAVPLLDLKAQHATIRDEAVRAMMQVVDDQAFILGAPVAKLECDVAGLSNTKYAVGCANGTDAILIAMRALDIGRGDEVVTTPFTFFATAGTIHNVGAKAVFVDIDPKTFFQRHMSPIRQTMLRGEKYPACEDCIVMEQYGKVSGREKQMIKVGIDPDRFRQSFSFLPVFWQHRLY